MTETTTAVRVDPAYADPDEILGIIRAIDEWWPLARYAGTAKEMEATGGERATAGIVPPWFRRDFAYNGVALVPGAERILANPAFVAAAHQVFGADAIVRPGIVYVNVMVPSPAPFVPHLDVPQFRGMTREDHPVWLLQQMMFSGLFERWRVRLATAVSWFFDGPGGAFHFWPAGADGPSDAIEPPFPNVAVLADNERTYHGVAPVGAGRNSMVDGLTRDSLLHRIDGGWEMRDGGRPLGRATDHEVRITVSWKAEVFDDDADRARNDEHTDDLTVDRVLDMFMADFAARGVDVTRPTDPHTDQSFVTALTDTYSRRPPRVPVA